MTTFSLSDKFQALHYASGLVSDRIRKLDAIPPTAKEIAEDVETVFDKLMQLLKKDIIA